MKQTGLTFFLFSCMINAFSAEKIGSQTEDAQMQYYALILIAVVMFGFQFFFNDRFQKLCGNTLAAAMLFSLGTSVLGIIPLLCINHFHLSCTPFTLLIAGLCAINLMLFSFCSIKALSKINLSLFSVFSMIGGMVLPFAVGILFFEEGMTVQKAVCLVLIVAGMCCTIEKQAGKKNFFYYIGIFVCNGMSGVLSMIYQKADFPKATAADYSILSALLRAGLSLAVLLIILQKEKLPRITLRIGADMACHGILNTVANYFLLLALAHVPGSMQYPLVTGGVMIISTAIGACTDKKPTKKDLLAVAFSFAGMLALVF